MFSLKNIDDYLPYLKMNTRLETIEFMDTDCRLNKINKIIRNARLKEVRGCLNAFKFLSEVQSNIFKVSLIGIKFGDIESFFSLPKISPEVVELSMNSFHNVNFIKNNIVR